MISAVLATKSGSWLSHQDFLPSRVDLLGPQEAPDILVADVAQSLGHEPARPAGIALRRRPPQHRQNAAVRRLVILGRGAAARARGDHRDPTAPLRRSGCANGSPYAASC